MLIAALAFALAADPEPGVYTLKVDANLSDVAAADLDGDGRQDILALSVAPEDVGGPTLYAFLAGADGAMPPQPSAAYTFEAESGGFFIAETDGEAGEEVVAVTATGARIVAWRDGAFKEIAAPRFVSFLPRAAEEPRFVKGLAEDLDDDGIDEWIIPGPTGYVVSKAGESPTTIETDQFSQIRTDQDGRPSVITHRLPQVFPFAIPEESTKAIAFLNDEKADFAYGPDWARHAHFDIPVALEDKWETSAQLKDINRDGLPDLVVTQIEGTLKVRQLTQVYLASGLFEYPNEPTQTFESRGALSAPVVEDLDGDGQLDLLFIKIEYGIGFFFNLLVRGRVSFTAEAHLFRDGFAESPNYSSKLSVEAPDGREAVAYTFGDFNGDGRMDAAYGTGADQFGVYLGEDKRFISTSAWRQFAMSPFGIARTQQLNDNDRDDLIIFHPVGSNRKSITVILF